MGPGRGVRQRLSGTSGEAGRPEAVFCFFVFCSGGGPPDELLGPSGEAGGRFFFVVAVFACSSRS